MNILVVSGILPLPGIDKSNDFLVPLYRSYLEKYPLDKVFVIKPTASRLISKWNKLNKGVKEYNLSGFRVLLLPYLSIWRFSNIHCRISSYTLFYLNRRKIIKLLKDFKIDVIQSEYIIPDSFLAYRIAKKFKIPYLVTSHNEFRYFNSFLSRRFVLKILNNASFITPLNYISLRTLEKYNVKNTQVIPLGIDRVFLNVNPENNRTGETRILSIGALISLKNFDKVLYALSNLKDKYHFKYTIIGSGPEHGSLSALADNLGLKEHVTLVNMIPYEEIPYEIGKYDMFIMPSYFETFGRVFFEAMAVGLPILYAKNTGIHGYFQEGEVGYSVTHNNIRDIEEKLSLLIGDVNLRAAMGKKAKETMQNYTWDKIVSIFNDLYKRSIKY